MLNPARGSVFLGAIALSVTVLFYFQPTVEAVALANISQNNLIEQFNNQNNLELQFNNQDSQIKKSDDKTSRQEQIQVQNPTDNSDVKDVKLVEGSSFRATAYCLKGRTAMGGGVRRGIVAADPRVFPLGSRIQIHSGPYSGVYTVADTGGAVRGRKLDIWVPTCSEASRFGRRSIMVSRLGKKS